MVQLVIKFSTPLNEIEILYHKIGPQTPYIKIPPNSEKIEEIFENGDAFIPKTYLNNIIVPEGRTKIKNHIMYYPIENPNYQ